MDYVAVVLLIKSMSQRRKFVDSDVNYLNSMMGRNVYASLVIISLMEYADLSVNYMRFMMGKIVDARKDFI